MHSAYRPNEGCLDGLSLAYVIQWPWIGSSTPPQIDPKPDYEMQSTVDIAAFLARQPAITSALRQVEALAIEDCWIGAGLIRNAIWDSLHGRMIATIPSSDVDVAYFDAGDTSIERDIAIEKRLFEERADIPWSVHNQARMHVRNGDAPYRNTEDAIRCWPETATAIAARLYSNCVEVIAPHGIHDLVNLIVRPTPAFAQKLTVYRDRVASKDWAKRWPKLQFIAG
jgi:uncharacterized protein